MRSTKFMMLTLLFTCLQVGYLYGDLAVTTHFYDTVTLPCSFPFVYDGVSVLWERIGEDGRKLLVHKFTEDQDHLVEQDPQYRGRTQLSKEFSKRRLDLTLRDVTFSDEGTYYCRAASEKGHGDLMVTLTIDRLNADDPKVSLLHIDGIRLLKCVTTGVFRDPKVKWTNRNNEDLSSYATNNITALASGKQTVESILRYDVETNVHYFCQITEGRLKRSARAVISDGHSAVTFDEL
ncbi:V-set domain containing T-cell activation inhibitor 1-like [Pseudophryne corroboree]|uniref:V-set domain containing T-cell activation inhibitor 1-like n=1 Tax=Pseudophryne corroboree TaxID=495146 RepID=UPI00308167B8